jgi:serine/threonine-protein kinase
MTGVPETIGSYRILKQLGAGAMGQVYLAEHRHLKRQAALKLLARELVERQDLLERFFLEARATSAIAHPGIVQIFDCEIDPTGRPYIVMELLTGETLASLVARQGALAPLQVARIGRSFAEALEAAHAKGIVHRDLKPENVFVQPDPPDSIKVVDFGIAKLQGDLQASQVHKTRSGSVMGTPLYMSPEQCRDSANIDFRTDIYSLGVVLFELATGRPPFTKDNFGELMVAHLTEAPPDPRALNPAIPPPLADLINDLLKKAPLERPPSMRAVAERLMAYVSRMTTVPGAASALGTAQTMGVSMQSPMPPSSTQPPASPPPPAAVRTTFGGAASEVELERPPSKRGPLIAGLVLLLGGGGAAAFMLGRSSEKAELAHVAAASAPTPPAPAAPAEPPKAPAESPKAPAPAEPAKAEPAAAVEAPAAEKRGKESRKAGRRGAGPAAAESPATPGSAPAAPTPPPAPPPEPRAAAPATSNEPFGSWEGPWVDAAHNQRGRLSLTIGPDGGAAGWMFNTSARASYRMAGRITPAGALDLGCQCPPGQAFVARGIVRVDSGELKGQLTLSAPTGVFGETRLTLHRSAAR